MTSANSAVSVRKMSCTARKSSALSALRTLLMFGSDRNGFSPIMYIPRTPLLSAAPTISVTVSPRTWSSSRPQALLEPLPGRGPVDRLVVGIEHRDQPGVGCALHVVLAAQRVQPRAGRGRPVPVIAHSAIRQRALSVPVVCWEIPIPQ